MSVASLESPEGRAPSGSASPPTAGGGGWAAFTLLALYGTLRWATMLEHGLGRLVICLGGALLVALGLRRLPRDRLGRWGGVGLGLAALLGALLEAGYPVDWVWHLRLARFVRALSHGVDGVPGILVPYTGGPGPVRSLVVLGGGACLLIAAVAFGGIRAARPAPGSGTGAAARGRRVDAPAGGDERRRTVAAVALLTLATVPSAIVTPSLVYLHALISAGLVSALLLGPRLEAGRRGSGIVLAVLALVVGATAVGALAGTRVWFGLGRGGSVTVPGPGNGAGGDPGAGRAGAGRVEGFDWTQSYGAQVWPRSGATMFTVEAARPTLWKAEDLDRFASGRWQPGSGHGDGLTPVDPQIRSRYTQTLTVQIQGLRSHQVIAAGAAARPSLGGRPLEPGADAGTWRAPDGLGPGDRYRVRVYAPPPTAVLTARVVTPARHPFGAPAGRPAALAAFLAVGRLGPAYAGVRRLAAGLRRSGDPIGLVNRVLTYLAGHETYTLAPPPGGAAPLATFLLRSHRGYCQQFAGAAALLLRLVGVPARVAVGFATGQRLGLGDRYAVRDTDAHAWIEVFFDGVGWVSFDPTPGRPADIAAFNPGGPGSSAALQKLLATRRPGAPGRAARAATGGGPRPDSGTGSTWTLGLVGLALLLGGAAGVNARRRRRRLDPGGQRRHAGLTDPPQLRELERAFRRCGRPLEPAETLGRLRSRFADDADLVAYLELLEAARFGPVTAVGDRAVTRQVTRAGRAALRRRLGSGAGPLGRGRALLALPPRRGRDLH